MRRLSGKRAPLAAAAAVAAMSLAACGGSSAASTAAFGQATGKPITVGISLPLTGSFSADGIATERGYQLWASDVNSHGGLLGRPVQLVIKDDKSEDSLTIQDYTTFITKDHVDLILAPFSSLLTNDAIGVADKYKYALPAGSAGAGLVYGANSPELFSTTTPVAKEMKPFADWITHLGANKPTTAAYPTVKDPFAQPPVTYVAGLLQAAGIRTVPTKVIAESATTGAANPAQIKADAATVAAAHPQLVVLGSVDVPTVATFIHALLSKGGTLPKYFIAAAGPDQGAAFLQAVGVSTAVGVMVPNGWYGSYPNALSHVMVQDYIAKYGGDASSINADVAEAYSAGQVLAAGVTGTNSTNNALITAYLHKHTVQTVVGAAKFNSFGENTTATADFIFQWQANAHFVQVLNSAGQSTGANVLQWAG